MQPLNASNGGSPEALSLQEAADRVGVAASTLRRWLREGLIPPYDGSWSPAAVSHARIVARLRERGHSLQDIRQASDEGRLAFGYVEELFDTGEEVYTLAQAARETGLEPALIERVMAALGTVPAADRIASRPRTSGCCATSPPCSTPGCRWSPCSSSCGCTGRRWRGWPTPR